MLKRFCRRYIYPLLDLVPDPLYLKLLYRAKMGKSLNLDNPTTMNEKLQWLKVYNRRPEYTDYVDKIKVKDIVAKAIGTEYVVPMIASWKRPEDIDFDKLPQKFVLKTNHSGGNLGVIVCRDKSKLDVNEARRRMAESLRDQNLYRIYREWPYKNVEPTIFAEELLESSTDPNGEVTDYKFYCFNGKVDAVLTCIDRASGDTKFYFFDRNWKLCRYNKRGVAAPEGFTIPKPEGIDKMFDLAEKLSKGFPFLRVDLYNVDGRIFFGEFTFFPSSGFDGNRMPEADKMLGDMIILPPKQK